MSAITWHLARTSLLAAVMSLSACAVHQAPNVPRTQEPIQSLPGVNTPDATPSKPSQPARPAAKPAKTSASFAPPPGGKSHWDQKLGVYVLEDRPNTFYRQRTYYRWNSGWSWSLSPNGPWQETDSSGVPGGLGRAFAQ